MKIRKATVADIPALVLLHRDVQETHAQAFPERFRSGFPGQVVAEALAQSIEAPSAYWLVAEKEQLIGFLSAEFRNREESWCMVAHRACYLSGIFVAASFRRQGIARALLDELTRETALRGASYIDLDVWASNPGAREAFARLGFKRSMERMTLPTGMPNT